MSCWEPDEGSCQMKVFNRMFVCFLNHNPSDISIRLTCTKKNVICYQFAALAHQLPFSLFLVISLPSFFSQASTKIRDSERMVFFRKNNKQQAECHPSLWSSVPVFQPALQPGSPHNWSAIHCKVKQDSFLCWQSAVVSSLLSLRLPPHLQIPCIHLKPSNQPWWDCQTPLLSKPIPACILQRESFSDCKEKKLCQM